MKKWIAMIWGDFRLFFLKLLRGSKMGIPRKPDGTLDENQISTIYIVCSPDGTPIYVVAITAGGPVTESATDKLVNEVKSSGVNYEECGIDEYVYYYHTQEQLQELRKTMKFRR